MRNSKLIRLRRPIGAAAVAVALLSTLVFGLGRGEDSARAAQRDPGLNMESASSLPAQEGQFPPGSFNPGIVLVGFKPEVPDSVVQATISANGTESRHVATYVNEDDNGNGVLDPGEDDNGNNALDKFIVYILGVTTQESEEVILGRFTTDPDVDFASLDFIGAERDHLTEPDDPQYPLEWGLNNRGQQVQGNVGLIDADIDAPQAWEHSVGDHDIIVAVLDSGIDLDHPDLAGNIFTNAAEVGGVAAFDDDGCGVADDFRGASFRGDRDIAPIGNFPGGEDVDLNGNGVLDPVVIGGNPDPGPAGNSHGTHVAGTIGAIGNNNRGVTGVNWEVTLLPIRTNYALAAMTAAGAYVACLSQRLGHNIRVLNFSAGISPFDRPGTPMVQVWNEMQGWQRTWTAILNVLNNANVLVVAAAGYDGLNVDTTLPEDRNGDGILNAGEDINGNGVLDPAGADNFGNGVLDAGEDTGSDGVPSPLEPGFHPVTNPDPNGDDFNPTTNPGGTEGNGRLDVGEDRPDGVGDFFLDLPCVLPAGNLICVTASDNVDNPSIFAGGRPANFGATSVDVYAPGTDIRSTIIDTYGFMSGTSMATPHVSGAAAHCLSLFPFDAPATVIAELAARVDPRPAFAGRVAWGPGNDGRLRMCMGDDFGDAPDPYTGPFKYPTKRPGGLLSPPRPAQIGASHEDIGDEWLGNGPPFSATRDNGDGQPRLHTLEVSPEFDADVMVPFDADGPMNLVDSEDDDDGIIIFGPILGFGVVLFQVCTENHQVDDVEGGRYENEASDSVPPLVNDKAIYVSGFFDWNQDGDWDDANEYEFSRRFIPPGAGAGGAGAATCHGWNVQPFFAPLFLPPGDIWARFRLDYGEDLAHSLRPPPPGPANAPDSHVGHPPPVPPLRYDTDDTLNRTLGLAQFGEVEDYKLAFIEVDYFPESTAEVTFNTPMGPDTVTLTGPTTVEVDLGSIEDTDGDGREQVQTEIVQLELTGTSALLGPVTVRLRDPATYPLQRSTGEIEEAVDTLAVRLDVPPFDPSAGAADSFFDVYFEIWAPGAPPGLQLLHNGVAKHMETTIDYKPPPPGTTYESPTVIPLLKVDGSESGISIGAISHTPGETDTPPIEPTKVGGILEFVDVDFNSLTEATGSSRDYALPIAAAAAGAVIVLAAGGGWYTRRRWMR